MVKEWLEKSEVWILDSDLKGLKMADYIPCTDSAFQMWANNFMDYANDHLADLGLTAVDLAGLSNMQADYNASMMAHITARQAAQSACQAKDGSRKEFKSALRHLVRQLQVADAVDDPEREALGITVADCVRTANTAEIITRPIGVVDTSQRLRHKIRFADESTPTRRAKPAGIMGCEIWVKVLPTGEAPPIGADELSFVFMDTASPHTVQHDDVDGGKMAHYMLRWVKRGGGKGPWSETISATITA